VNGRGFRVASADAGGDDTARALSLVVAFPAANGFDPRIKSEGMPRRKML